MVIWTLRASADLKAIHDHIAKDSRERAKRVAHEIRRKADTLAEPPRLGHKVPELNDPQLREISI
jgi:plasmid stabilization system protein ParE